MDKKEMKRLALLEHYKELNHTARHYNQQFWLIPGASVSLIVLIYSLAFNSVLFNPFIKTAMLWLSVSISLVFVIKMIHQRVYQVQNKKRIAKVRKKLKIDKMSEVENTRSFNYWTRSVHVSGIIITIMILIWLVQLLIAILWKKLIPPV